MWQRRLSILSAAALWLFLGTPARFAWCAGGTGGADESGLVERVATDYLEGWYTADPERLGRALHPDMVKRYVDARPGGRQVVHSVTRDLMIEMTRMGGGSKKPAEGRNISIQALEVSGDIAVARASSSDYLEYLSLAKCNGQWVIVNILWRFQSSGGERR